MSDTIVAQHNTNVKLDTITLIVQYEGTPHHLRSKGIIIEVRRNGDPGRKPKNTNLDSAIRWLADNGYKPILKEFRFLDGDKSGVTTFQPRRRQVYRKEVLA